MCTSCFSDLIVFIYQVWGGNRMRVFPVISPLFSETECTVTKILQLALRVTRSLLSEECVKKKATDQKTRHGCFTLQSVTLRTDYYGIEKSVKPSFKHIRQI